MKRLALMMMAAMMAAAGWADEGFAYQGSLYLADGKPVATKSVPIVFRLYDGAASTTELWARKISVRTDADGFFNVELNDSQGVWVGKGTMITVSYALYEIAKNNKSPYLGLTVEGSTGEIRPRQKLLAAPLASFAATGFESADETFEVGGKLTIEDASTFNGDVTFEGGAIFSGATTISEEASVSNAVFTSTSANAVGSCCVMPLDTIIMWWGATNNIPEGWKLCNGENGTPDLRGVFPLGVGEGSQKGQVGGSETVTLTTENLPSHAHRYANDEYVFMTGSVGNQGMYDGAKAYDETSRDGKYLYYYNTSTNGGSKAHNNMPPYLAVHFIMRVK